MLAGVAMAKRNAGDRHAFMHQNAFIFVVPGVAFLELSVSKSYEITEKSTKIA